MLALLAMAPVVLWRLGPEGLGVWEVLVSLQTSVALLHTVASAVTLWAFSEHYGRGNVAAIRRGFQCTLGTLTLGGVVALPLLIWSGTSLVSEIKATGGLTHQALVAVPWLAIVVYASTINQAGISAIASCQRVAVAAAIEALGIVTATLTTVTLLLSGKGLLALPIGLTLGAIVTLAASQFTAARCLGQRLPWRPALPNREELQRYGPFAAIVLVTSVTVLARDQADRFLIATMDSAETTGRLAIAQRCAGLTLQMAAVLLTPMAVAVAASNARGDWRACRLVYSRYAQFTAAMAGGFALVIWVLRAELLEAWLGDPMPERAPLSALEFTGRHDGDRLERTGGDLRSGGRVPKTRIHGGPRHALPGGGE